MGRQSLQIQPQPEPRFITEYKKKKELHRKTQGNIFLYDFSEETNQSENGSLKCATPDLLKEVKEVISVCIICWLENKSNHLRAFSTEHVTSKIPKFGKIYEEEIIMDRKCHNYRQFI